MATHDYVIDNSTGANVRADLNLVLQAILSNNSSSSAPSTTAAYMWWADTTNGILKIRNSANNAWVELLQLDGTLTLEDGSASTPALAFRDDLNTGIFSSAADTFNVATAGVERMELGAATVFNEDGADVDFRIEGDTEANLFYVDAGNDRVGIATSSPETLVHVKVSDVGIAPHGSAQLTLERAGTNYLQFLTAANGTSGLLFGDANDIDVGKITYDHNLPAMQFYTETNIRMVIDSSGRLLVGSSSAPAGNRSQYALISVTGNSSGATGHGIFNIQAGQASSDGNEVAQLCFSDTQGDYAWIQAFADGATSSSDKNGRLVFSTSPDGAAIPTERMRIDSSGRLLVGTTTALNASADDLVIGNGVGTRGITLFSANANDGNIFFADGTSGSQHYSGFLQYSHAQDEMRIGTSGDNALFIKDVSANRDVHIVTGDIVFDVAGRGIDFSADGNVSGATSELFDDYEHGTFTPAMNQGINVTSYTNQDGHYVKVGNLVQVSFRIQLSGSGNSNHVRFQGLPINSANLTNYHSGGIVTYTNIPGISGSGITSVWQGGNSSLCELYKDGNSSVATGSGGFTSKEIYIVITYQSD